MLLWLLGHVQYIIDVDGLERLRTHSDRIVREYFETMKKGKVDPYDKRGWKYWICWPVINRKRVMSKKGKLINDRWGTLF